MSRSAFSRTICSDKGEDWWLEISRLLTGRTDEEIDSLGGVRIIVGEDTVAFQRIPTAA